MNPEELDSLENALRSQPLAELPPGLHRRILSQVRQTRQPVPFRLRWIDLALSLFFGLLPVLLAWAWTLLPREAGLYFNYYWMVFQSLDWEPVLWAFLLVGTPAAILLFVAALKLVSRPALRVE